MKSANNAQKEIEKLKQEVSFWIDTARGFQNRLKEIHRIAHTKSLTRVTKLTEGSSKIEKL